MRKLGVQTRERGAIKRVTWDILIYGIYGKYTILRESIRIVKVNLYKLAMKMNTLKWVRY